MQPLQKLLRVFSSYPIVKIELFMFESLISGRFKDSSLFNYIFMFDLK